MEEFMVFEKNTIGMSMHDILCKHCKNHCKCKVCDCCWSGGCATYFVLRKMLTLNGYEFGKNQKDPTYYPWWPSITYRYEWVNDYTPDDGTTIYWCDSCKGISLDSDT